jgi:hypothetical protein
VNKKKIRKEKKTIKSPNEKYETGKYNIWPLKEKKSLDTAMGQWLMLVIIATWEAESKRIMVWGHPRKTVCETPSSK